MILSEEEIRSRVIAAFSNRERIQAIYVKDWDLTVVISVGHRFGKVPLADLVRLAEKLNVAPENIELWDGGLKSPDTIEISIDCDTPTPIERPRGKTIPPKLP
jgi:hypothetical protein